MLNRCLTTHLRQRSLSQLDGTKAISNSLRWIGSETRSLNSLRAQGSSTTNIRSHSRPDCKMATAMASGLNQPGSTSSSNSSSQITCSNNLQFSPSRQLSTTTLTVNNRPATSLDSSLLNSHTRKLVAIIHGLPTNSNKQTPSSRWLQARTIPLRRTLDSSSRPHSRRPIFPLSIPYTSNRQPLSLPSPASQIQSPTSRLLLNRSNNRSLSIHNMPDSTPYWPLAKDRIHSET